MFPDTPKNEAGEARINDISDKIESDNLIDRYIYESTGEVRYAVAQILRRNPFRNRLEYDDDQFDNLVKFVAECINESDNVPCGEYMDPEKLPKIVFDTISELYDQATPEQIK